MFRIFRLFIFTLLFALNDCRALELSHEESMIFENFFRMMLEQSEGGYVFYGKKPICITGFRLEDYFLQESDRHLASVYLREGALKWKNLNQKPPQQEIIVHVYNGEDSLVKNFIHILFINKELCLNTIKSNLPLFQYILGPDVTPLSLLNKLTDPNSTFHSVLKDNKVLIGILLGFGTQNALYVSRIEYLGDELFSPEHPPFKSLLSLDDVPPEFKQVLLLNNTSSDCSMQNQSQNLKAKPSFGYLSIKDEIQNLNKKITISSLKLARNSPAFIFGRLKEDPETDRLVSELEKTQTTISQLLTSNAFLEDVLHFIYPNEPITIQRGSNKQLLMDDSELNEIPFLVAANIWSVFKDENSVYRQFFIAGMKEAEKASQEDLKHEIALIDTFKYDKLKTFSKIKNNLQEADDYFGQLDKDKSYIPLSPFTLYYKTLQEGSGTGLNLQTNVSLLYIVKTPSHKILASHWESYEPLQIDLMDTIPGFAWGLKGMKIGEIREIYIHPSLAYGIYTTIDKGIYLKALVQLTSIHEPQKEEIFPALTTLDLKLDINDTIDLDYEEQSKKVGYSSGYQIWNHYKKLKFYSLAKILEWIDRFQIGEEADISSETKQNSLNRLHWNIYQQDIQKNKRLV